MFGYYVLYLKNYFQRRFMGIFKRIIEFLNKMKKFDIWGDKDVELTEEQMKYIRSQNPYGMTVVVLSILAFLFPQYGLSIITLFICILTYFTFDKEKEDNPWPFYIGIFFSLLGLMMFFTGEVHKIGF